jgi:hypothetical protein
MNKENSGEEILPEILFLRNLVEEIDSISILVSHSAIDSSKSLLRTELENLLYIEYLFQKDTTKRAMSFLFWDAINQHNRNSIFDSKSSRGKELKAKIKKDKLLSNFNPFENSSIKEIQEQGKILLKQEMYRATRDEYYKTKNKINKSPNWYSLYNGPKSLQQLANIVGYPAIYEIFYRNYSSSTHGNDIIRGKLKWSEDERLQVVQIRHPEDLKLVVINSYHIAIQAYFVFLKNRLPEKRDTFNQWYRKIKTQFDKIIKTNIIIN